jgi:hypothetical protein
VEALEGLASIRVGDPGKRLGVAEGGLLCLGVQVGLPPRGQRVDLRAWDPSVAGGLVVEVETVAAVVELRNSQSQELREAALDAQRRFVSERVRAHARHAHQGLVLRRIGAVLRDLDLVTHSSALRSSSLSLTPLPRGPPNTRWPSARGSPRPRAHLLGA